MTKPILVVGAGPAGLAAAHSLASVGQKVVLVEKEDTLGGAPILSGYAKLVPSGEWAKDAIGSMVDRVVKNKLITIHKGASVKEFSGKPGAFKAELSNGKKVSAGATILCTGFTHFDSVNKPEWGFGQFPDVVTTTQVEQMISSGQGVRRPSNGEKPKRVAILLCVGSRDRQLAANGALKFAVQYPQKWAWKFAKRYLTATFISIIWIFVHSAFTRKFTGNPKKSTKSNTSNPGLPKSQAMATKLLSKAKTLW